MSNEKKFFLAARKEFNKNETCLILADPWTGERHEISESALRDKYDIQLGDWVHANVDPQKTLYNISKTEHTARITTKIVGNVAVVENIMSKLNSVNGQLVFQNKLFGDSVYPKELTPGDYKIKINLLEKPVKLPTGKVVHFEATEPEPKQPKQVIGAGFPVVAKRDEKIVGEGFQVAPKKDEPVKMRAVVLSKVERPIGTHYYLWNIDSRTEGLFVSKVHDLQPGHFFEGSFKKKDNNRWTCQKYEKPLPEPLFKGGVLPNNKIYFTVKIDKFQPAKGNAKYAFANAKYIGDVLEGESERTKLSADCNGKMVNIQRRGIGEQDFVWMVTEIL